MNSLLKFITCGSVDDGKSTLIGHMLYDAKLLFADQKRALELDSKVGSRGGAIDYSLLLDGLMAEREQGITIDVAYRYFTTEHRSFIVADTPGHEEYTRNMAVGASFAELAVILVDATQGVLVQTRRHTRICSLMGIEHFVFAVNKMDLINYDANRFEKIEREIKMMAAEYDYKSIKILPVSATEGDNVTVKSTKMPWYKGESLLTYLENIQVHDDSLEKGFTMPVQRVCRPDRTFRGFQGQIESGQIKVGDEIIALPSNEKAEVKGILDAGKEVTESSRGHAVTISLDREVDVSRGCVLVHNAKPKTGNLFTAKILWMDDTHLVAGKNYLLKLGTKMIPAVVMNIKYKIDVNTGNEVHADAIYKNEIAACDIAVSDKIVFEKFKDNHALGSMILIDRITNMTSACGVIMHALRRTDNLTWHEMDITREFRAQQKGQTPKTIWLTGLSGSGKSTLMNMLGCLDVPTSGTYLLHDQDVSRMSDDELSDIRNREIGFIFQGFNLIQNLTALENVELPLIYRGVGKRERTELSRNALTRVGLEKRMSHKPSEMSGGQQQRVAIARAIAQAPPVILADEPTGNLDSGSTKEIMGILKDLHKEGRTVIIITHDNDIAAQAERVIRIKDGQIEADYVQDTEIYEE